VIHLKRIEYADSSRKYKLLRLFTMLTLGAVYCFTGAAAAVCVKLHVLSWILILAILLMIACTGLVFRTFGNIWKEG
jgi:hypothetical protein